MTIETGTIVKSTAGRDKNGYFCVVELSDDYALIADGKSRKLESPKRKKLKHIQITPYKLQSESLQVNKHLKKAIDSLIEL